LLYTDDLVVIAETKDDLIKRLNEWKDSMDNRGMSVNINKTKVMISGERHDCKMAMWCLVEAFVILQYNVLVKSGYIGSVMV